MTVSTNATRPSYRAILHLVYAVFGVLGIGALLFSLGWGVVGAVAFLGMMGAAASPWLAVLASLAWAGNLSFVFFFLRKPEFAGQISSRDRYTLVAAFLGGGMVPWLGLTVMLFAGEGITRWGQLFSILLVPPFGYLTAAAVHAVKEGHGRHLWERLRRGNAK